MAHITIGTLSDVDVGAALALSIGEGWNQSDRDWARVIRLEPDGCFGAWAGDRLIGTVTTTTYRLELAWIGMMIVHPEFRRRGIGRDLMRVALEHTSRLAIPTVKLDATPAGQPLYESLGFVTEKTLERWQGVVSRGAMVGQAFTPGDSADLKVCPAFAEIDSIFKFDRAACGVDRSRLLKALAAEALSGALIARGPDRDVAGFALARSVRNGVYIGPVVATTTAAADALMTATLNEHVNQEAALDLHAGGRLSADRLIERGLSKRRLLTRMRYGKPHDAALGPAIVTSAGPQFG